MRGYCRRRVADLTVLSHAVSFRDAQITVVNVDDAAVVAAIAAAELDGLAAALDRYAASLYQFCYSMAPEVAADVVRDTFIVAWSRLGELRDPGQLQSWLQAIAGNECFRRSLTNDAGEVRAGNAPEASLPPGLPGQVLSACADNTPVGRAQRVSITHRAGPFGHDGFPKANLRRHGTWLSGLRRRSRAAAPVVAAAAVLAVAGSTLAMILPAGSSHNVTASPSRPGGQASAASPASDAGLPTTPARPIPSSSAANSAGRPRHPAAPAGKQAGAPEASPPVVPMATVQPVIVPSMPSPSLASSSVSAAPGVLAVDQARLHFVSIRGGTSMRSFALTAEGGPVGGYTIAVPSGLPGSLTVSPSSGSLAAAASARITVTAAATVPFVTTLTVYPGDIVITLVVKASP
jgi:hypothetical protein